MSVTIPAMSSIFDPLEFLKRRDGGMPSEGRMRPPRGARRFAILRVSKIKTVGTLAAAARHNLRERDAPNADPARSGRNRILVGAGTAEGVMQAWDERAPDKIRVNAVRAIESVMTASPEAMQEMGAENSIAYLEAALDWLKGRFGAENVISAVVHEDETTPHLQAMVIPLDARGKLNARELIGGPAGLRQMQTDFARDVGEKFGLERGLEKSRATHETVKSYYHRANATEDLTLELPKRATGGGLLGRGRETDEEWRQRASESAAEVLRGAVASFHALSDDLGREAAQARAVARSAQQEVERSETAVAALTAFQNISGMNEGQVRDRIAGEFAVMLEQTNRNMPPETLAHLRQQLAEHFGITTPGRAATRDLGCDHGL